MVETHRLSGGSALQLDDNSERLQVSGYCIGVFQVSFA